MKTNATDTLLGMARKTLASAMVVAALGLAGCATDGEAPEAGSSGNTSAQGIRIYKNGAIYTVNQNQPWAEAMVIENGTIKYVGNNDEAARYEVAGARIIDLAGKMVLPGIHDVHIHPLESGSDNTHFELNYDETNAENFIPAIRQAAVEFPGQDWLIGYGHNIDTLLMAPRNPVAILDEAVSDRPVIIMEQTSHSMWVNSRALTLAGISKDTANPAGGVIMKDATGKPTGVLIDNAGEMVMHLAMAATPERMQSDYNGLVNSTLPLLAKHGITSIADARAYWRRGHHSTWQKVEQNNRLTARVVLGLWAYPEDDDAAQIATLKSLYSNDPNKRLRINQIKVYSDGIVSNTSAAMHSPYQFDILGLPENKGLNYFTQTRLQNYIAQLEPVGFDFHIHAIGDRGIHQALNAIESAGTVAGRHRLTHVEVLDPSDTPRFAPLNVTADCQVAGDFTHPSHWQEMAAYIGTEKANNLVPIKSLRDANARVTLSSDWSVSPFNPFIGLQNAVTRTPQSLSLADAIAAYTINAAYVMRQENKVGSLEVGKEADLVVLNQNIFKINPGMINQTRVLQTLLAGKEVYHDPAFK